MGPICILVTLRWKYWSSSVITSISPIRMNGLRTASCLLKGRAVAKPMWHWHRKWTVSNKSHFLLTVCGWAEFTPLPPSLQMFSLIVNLWCKLDLKKESDEKWNSKNSEGRVQWSCFLSSVMLQLAWFPDIAYPSFNGCIHICLILRQEIQAAQKNSAIVLAGAVCFIPKWNKRP